MMKRTGERGMTMIEMMMALSIFSLVMGAAMAFVRAQAKGFAIGTDRLTVVQNMRYATGVWGKDLRTVGANVPDEQPFLVLATNNTIVFNADFTTNIADDPWAVYYDPDASTGFVTALEKIDRLALPGGTGMLYPDTNYKAAGSTTMNSAAETIMFYFAPDSSSSRTDDYVLYRKVNADPGAVVARNLLQTPGKPFFQYYRLVTPANAPQRVDTVAAAALPLKHTKAIHLSPTDTGIFAQIDSVRGARISFTATNGATGAAERKRAITRLVWMPNAGLTNRKTCGDEPQLGGGISFAAVLDTLDDGATVADDTRVVRLSWQRATDEFEGELDVARYVIWRRRTSVVDWGDPFESMPAGLPVAELPYTFVDATVERDSTYQYSLAAQDCTPRLSLTNAVSGNIFVTP